jgi:hypothetical protein
MNRLLAVTIVAVISFLPPAIQAAPVTIDFEEFNIGDGPANSTDWISSNGYEFSGTAFPGPFPDGLLAEIFIGNSGSKSFGASSIFNGQDGFGAFVTISMRKADGGAFAISSMDMLLQATGSPLASGSTSITGALAGGSAAELSVPVGTGDWLNLELVTFIANGDGFGFGHLTAVEIDNINVSAVPIPAAVWLFGSALAGLGWMRRKQAV